MIPLPGSIFCSFIQLIIVKLASETIFHSETKKENMIFVSAIYEHKFLPFNQPGN